MLPNPRGIHNAGGSYTRIVICRCFCVSVFLCVGLFVSVYICISNQFYRFLILILILIKSINITYYEYVINNEFGH